ncbi:DUF2970 domain-containing protein [Pseudomonas sp. DTU_2021_1001937_2_SI_NGA_ILE_001]|uniref:DUF2970 domain-containing protein n=1 Tax=Pseudomonas sp. DTU_2021_1001937_2_SI_NGA_ILE_001 TaxID=3077589 RepID=UPI0026000D19|nr:DUF2970 domain-containing protein [Pseudomonas sp. DTU_2021_1001937_2_SI_NGA_ILE_001]WNW10461.1 DUF2970 domain-containing protein [Pseudomonas sp. DTU_2021_1001937_2_SI_NGA_ILE_001]
MDNKNSPTEKKSPPTFWQMLHSVLAAAFGVQSERNRQRDFSHDKPWHFVVLGLGFTLVFALGLLLIVRLVLYFLGA